MRIGEPARNHDVPDAGIWHAVRTAAHRFEQLADELVPATIEVDHPDHLRQVAAVCEAVRADEARLRETVAVARAHGRSWNQIAIARGVSRQAACQRFTDKADD
ncbi:MAG: sigma-70 family RNA polymerase sigma factor [Actinomycetes bacterium]